MAGILQPLEDVLGINTTAGTDQLKQAMAALQSVGVPTAQQLSLPELQKYVSAGVLTPQQYQAIAANPQAYQDAVNSNLDTSGTSAEKAALQQLGGISQTGSTPILAAQLANIRNQQGQVDSANRAANLENAQQRGVAGGGLEFLSNLVGEQNSAQNANLAGVNAGANNAQLALQALSQMGSLGGQLQGQSNQMATNAGQAAQQIAEYNSGLQSAANQYNAQNANQAQQMNLANAQNVGNMNTQNANARTQYNAQVPQQVFSDQIQKAGGIANNYGQQGQLAQQQAGQQNAFVGNLIGAGATLGGNYLAGQAMKQAPQYGGANGPAPSANTNQYSPWGYAMGGEVRCYAQGGEVHDHQLCMKAGGPVPGDAQVPGDSAQNDTVPAMLSPHEIVLPRSVAQSPDAPQQAANFVAQTKGMTPTVNSFAEALQKLEENGLELRLSQKAA